MEDKKEPPLVILIDNYDSFVYNLYQYVLEKTRNVVVFRNDAISVKSIDQMNPGYIIISPGPKAPQDAGLSSDIIFAMKDKCRILGVCLGHQCINEVFGGKTIRAPNVLHGKTSVVFNDGASIYSGLPISFTAARYHSLIADPEYIPDSLQISAWTQNGVVMGLRHHKYEVEGIQFHPESFLTQYGKLIVHNFIYGSWNKQPVQATEKVVAAGI